MQHYLNTSEDDVYSPTLLDNIDKGAKMLIKHLATGNKIFIQVDSDCDGFSSAAALINYINMIAPGHAQNNIQYRIHEEKQHGLIVSTIPDDVKLVIAPDSSSNDYIQHQELFNKGIDVLVLDHHEAEKVSQYACVINNQLCNYPNKSLSGVGIVYKFCSYIDLILGQKMYSDDILDLVALGVIADVMSLKNFETKYLITQGIQNFRNPFIIQMAKNQAYSLGEEITPIGIAFYIAPYVNATIRTGSMEDKKLLFESMLDFKAYEQIPSTKRGCKGQFETRVEQACRHCSNVKSRQTKLRDSSFETIKTLIEENNLLDLPILLIQLDTYIDKNLIGLIANEIANKYQRPTALLNKYEENGQIIWKGSCRNNQFSPLNNFRKFLLSSNCVNLAEGHASAFGLEILDNKINDLKAYIKDELNKFDTSSCYYVDFIWPFSQLSEHIDDIIKISEYKSCWGQDMSEPYVVVEQIKLTQDNLILMSPDKHPTLKIKCDNGLTLIKFKSSQEEYEKLLPISNMGCTVINLVGTCECNIWNGQINPQIQIKDYNIVNQVAYYF